MRTSGYAGLVYLFSVRNGERYKIGYTKGAIKQRQALLAGKLQEPVTVVHAVPVEDAPFVEKKLHKHFAQQALGNEWFDFNADDIDLFPGLVAELARTSQREDFFGSLGDRIKKAREQRGWSQRDLARNAEVNHAWISRLENGERYNISLDAAAKLARALGLSLDYLAGLVTRHRVIASTSTAETVGAGREVEEC